MWFLVKGAAYTIVFSHNTGQTELLYPTTTVWPVLQLLRLITLAKM